MLQHSTIRYNHKYILMFYASCYVWQMKHQKTLENITRVNMIFFATSVSLLFVLCVWVLFIIIAKSTYSSSSTEYFSLGTLPTNPHNILFSVFNANKFPTSTKIANLVVFYIFCGFSFIHCRCCCCMVIFHGKHIIFLILIYLPSWLLK